VYGNEPTGSIKLWEFLQQLSKNSLLNKESDACSQLHIVTWWSGLLMGFGLIMRFAWHLNCQLVTTLHKSLSHTDYCFQSRSSLRCLVAASNCVASSASTSSGFCSNWLAPFSCSSRAELNWLPTHKSKSKLCYDRRFSRPVYPGKKHPSGDYDKIFITVIQLQACWCGALSLTRGWICPLTDSVSSMYKLHVTSY
jgi:hypothetical protein